MLLQRFRLDKASLRRAHRSPWDVRCNSSRVPDYPIRLAARFGDRDLAIDLIRNSRVHRNYRWLVRDPDIASFRNEPHFRQLLYELYSKWQCYLAALVPSLPVRPPKLPTPEEYLSVRCEVNL